VNIKMNRDQEFDGSLVKEQGSDSNV